MNSESMYLIYVCMYHMCYVIDINKKNITEERTTLEHFRTFLENLII